MKQRHVLARRLFLDESAANAARDMWKRDGLALGAKPAVVKVYHQVVSCDYETVFFFVVIAYGLPIDKP